MTAVDTATPAALSPAPGRQALVGTGALVRLALRRDRVLIPVWVAVFTLMAVGSANATIALYHDPASVRSAVAGLNSTPALVALYGRIYDDTALGGIAMLKLSGFGAALLGVVAAMLVIRHTRADEEAGRGELLGAGVIGRHAALTAALIVTVGTMVTTGLLTALGLVGVGLPAAGSIAFGLAWALTGCCFAAIAAVTAQLPNNARTATGLASALLGVSYVLRAVGDSATTEGGRWVSWLSPIGWGQQVRAFGGERWWVAAIPVAFCVLVAGLGYRLAAGRDLGSGLLPDRTGPATARPWLRSPLALAVRLQRGTLAGWATGFLGLGLVLGNVASNLGAFADSASTRDLFTKLGGRHGLTDAFLATDLRFMGIAAAAYGVQATLRLRAEESALRAEPILATAVGRRRWLAGHLLVAMLGSTALMLVGAVAAGASFAAASGDGGQFGRVLAGGAVQLPAVLVLIGITVAAFGTAPRFGALGWVALVTFLLIDELGSLFGLSRWALDLSPFAHVPRVPGGPVEVVPLVTLTVIAAALVAVGVQRFRDRDLAA